MDRLHPVLSYGDVECELKFRREQRERKRRTTKRYRIEFDVFVASPFTSMIYRCIVFYCTKGCAAFYFTFYLVLCVCLVLEQIDFLRGFCPCFRFGCHRHCPFLLLLFAKRLYVRSSRSKAAVIRKPLNMFVNFFFVLQFYFLLFFLFCPLPHSNTSHSPGERTLFSSAPFVCRLHLLYSSFSVSLNAANKSFAFQRPKRISTARRRNMLRCGSLIPARTHSREAKKLF